MPSPSQQTANRGLFHSVHLSCIVDDVASYFFHLYSIVARLLVLTLVILFTEHWKLSFTLISSLWLILVIP